MLERIAPVEMYAGPGPLKQVIPEEFGTIDEAPHPFIRPAFDRGADAAVLPTAKDLHARVVRRRGMMRGPVARGVVDHHDRSAHFRMDVAEEIANPRPVESDYGALAAGFV